MGLPKLICIFYANGAEVIHLGRSMMERTIDLSKSMDIDLSKSMDIEN